MLPQLFFNIQTLQVKDGAALKAMKPDKDGIYRGIPLTVLGQASRNNKFYDERSVVDCITNPKSRFFINLTEGNLEGEWGHPLIARESDIARLAHIERERVSHYFTRVYTERMGNMTVVFGDVVPFGPYGKYLKESLEDPRRNTAFSLRSLCARMGQDGSVTRQRMLALITFDAVDGPGYEMASKRFAASTESISIQQEFEYLTNVDQLQKESSMRELLGVEAITEDQICELLGTEHAVIANEALRFDVASNQLYGKSGRKSIFHTFFGGAK